MTTLQPIIYMTIYNSFILRSWNHLPSHEFGASSKWDTKKDIDKISGVVIHVPPSITLSRNAHKHLGGCCFKTSNGTLKKTSPETIKETSKPPRLVAVPECSRLDLLVHVV